MHMHFYSTYKMATARKCKYAVVEAVFFEAQSCCLRSTRYAFLLFVGFGRLYELWKRGSILHIPNYGESTGVVESSSRREESTSRRVAAKSCRVVESPRRVVESSSRRGESSSRRVAAKSRRVVESPRRVVESSSRREESSSRREESSSRRVAAKSRRAAKNAIKSYKRTLKSAIKGTLKVRYKNALQSPLKKPPRR